MAIHVSKRVAVGALGVAAALAVVFAVFLFVVAPEIVRGKAVAMAHRRGVTLSIRSVQIGVGSVTLAGVQVSRGPLSASLDAVRVEADLWRLWGGDRRAVEGVHVLGGEGRLNLDALDSDGEVARRPPPGSRSLLRDAPNLLVDRVRLFVTQGERTLAQTGATHATLEGTELELQSDDVQLEGGSFEVLLDRVTVSIDAATRTVSWVETRGGQLRVAEASGGLTHALAHLERLAEPAAGSGDKAIAGPANASLQLRAQLAQDAQFRMEDMEIVYPSGPTGAVLASGIQVRVDLEEGTSVHTTGKGQSEAGGPFHWDLSLDRASRALTGNVAFDEFPMAGLVPVLPSLPWHKPDETTLSWNLDLTHEGGVSPLLFSGRVLVRKMAFDSARLAPDPVRFSEVSLSGNGTLDLATGRVALEEGAVSLGDANARVRGFLTAHAGDWSTDLYVDLSPIPCGAAISAIPADLLGDLSGFALSGTLSGSMHAVIDSQQLQSSELSLRVSEACRFDSVPGLADLRRFEGPFMHRVQEPDGEWFEMTTGPGSGNWTSIYQLSPFFVHAVLAHEDASFFRHDGFAPWAIRDALVKNLEAGRFAYGASTISMQLAKNLFLRREKNLARKVQEVLLTWWLEEALEKEDILELYLNVIEYGRALYGIRRASWHYFGRDPAELSPAEAVFLATALPSPKSTYQHFIDGGLSGSVKNRMRRLLEQMHRRGRIDGVALGFGLEELSHFRFRGEGEGRAPARILAGATERLPYEAAGFGFWGTEDPFAVEEQNPYEPDEVDGDSWPSLDRSF